MYIGGNISKSGGYLNALLNSLSIGANAMQVFTGAPQMINLPLNKLTEEDYNDFNFHISYFGVKKIKKYKDFNVYIHAPYVINLCNPDKLLLNKKILIEELIICDYMNARGVVIHMGTKLANQTYEESILIYIKSIKYILQKYKGKSKLLLETTAGQGNSIGISIPEFANIFNSFTIKEKSHLGITVDTCHIYAAGYDISTYIGITNYFLEFNSYIDIKYIKLIHLNDSKTKYYSRVDQHAKIGQGYIFGESLQAIEILKGLGVPCILETHDIYPYENYRIEIELIRSLKIKSISLEISDKDIKDKNLIIEILSELANIYYIMNDRFRADSYNEAIYKITKLYIIPDTKKELMHISSIGDSISDKILEILKTKKLKILLEIKTNPKIQALLNLLSIKGIGKKKALELIKKDIYSYDDLYKKYMNDEIKLTNAQKLGVVYYNDLHTQIPYKEALTLQHYLHKYNKNIQLVGSFRRKQKLINDIDIIAYDISIDDIIDKLEEKYNIVGYITKGTIKTTFLMIIDNIVRQIDILITTEQSYYLALLYFTGSKYFNIYIRTFALQYNMKINEYELLKNNKRVNINSEEEIFEVLKMQYIKPEYR